MGSEMCIRDRLRTLCQDVDDPTGRKHKLMRYEMVIDVEAGNVYHDA